MVQRLDYDKRAKLRSRIILSKRMALRNSFSPIDFTARSSFISDNDILLFNNIGFYIQSIIIVQ